MVVVEARTGRVLDRQGTHSLLLLGAEGAAAYWRRRLLAPLEQPEEEHAARYRAAHPASPALLARLQPAE